ncbi:MAG: OFA family MFS transporter [Acidobacteria bacterium]|nr:OFA family MFS transporter [Acidobacteriota bacterium]
MQVALGAVYAWSVFRIPLTRAYGWSIGEVTLAFTIAIFVLGFAAFAGGLWMQRAGPRPVALAAGAFYGAGVFLASLAGGRLWLLYCSYGLVGGAGLGLGYIVPVATLVKWFPDRRGMITGIAVAGFGSGALITAPLATRLIATMGAMNTFAVLGVVYLVAVMGAGAFMRNPPAGYRPPGWSPSAAQQRQRSTRAYTLREAMGTWQWYGLWALLFLNTTAGIAIISQAGPMAEEIARVTPAAAAGLVGAIAIANGAGRFLWASLSDYTGRRAVFLAMFPIQAAIFALLPGVESFGLLTTLTCAVLLCYGGGFGTMPAFAADYFGAENVGSIYGLMLTAWGFAGVLGPMLIAALRESTGRYHEALYVIAALMLVSTAIPVLVRPPTGTTMSAETGVRG